MKRVLFILLMFLTVDCFAGIFDAFYKKEETKIDSKTENKITTTIDKQTKDIKAGLNDIKAGVNENKVDLEALNENIVNFKTDVEAKIVGLDKSVKAGRDVINVKKNDARILIVIAGGLFTFMTTLVVALIGVISLLIKKIFKRQREVDQFRLKFEAEKYYRENLQRSKDYYKNMAVKNGFK